MFCYKGSRYNRLPTTCKAVRTAFNMLLKVIVKVTFANLFARNAGPRWKGSAMSVTKLKLMNSLTLPVRWNNTQQLLMKRPAGAVSRWKQYCKVKLLGRTCSLIGHIHSSDCSDI